MIIFLFKHYVPLKCRSSLDKMAKTRPDDLNDVILEHKNICCLLNTFIFFMNMKIPEHEQKIAEYEYVFLS